MPTILVTGGAGFIGSNFIRYWLSHHPDDVVVNLDRLTYAGTLTSLHDVAERYPDRYRFVRGDIGNSELVRHLLASFKPAVVVNFAAESHNSRAVVDPDVFFHTNVLATQRLAAAVRDAEVARFHHVSTCEVYGDLPLDAGPEQAFTEHSPFRPRTPYNAAKAGGDLAVRAYHDTFGLPATISHCSNNYGPYQFPEKVIPLFAISALQGRPLPVYRSSAHRREWLHVEDHCRALERIVLDGAPGSSYNIGSGVELSVDQVADLVLDALGLEASRKQYVPDRPGHDRRYLLDSAKIRAELGWEPKIPIEQGIRETVAWYRDHRWWWQPLLDRLAVDEHAWQDDHR
jgi:dTDP-glucose 4,6-dehydratase